MAKHLKKSLPPVESEAANLKVQETVREILADVRQRGDAAVRELSERFDGWSPPDFRLSPGEIDSLVASVSRQTIEDIKFAQAQIRNFAEHQRAALKDVEVETIPGRTARPPQHSSTHCRLLHSGRALSDGGIRPHDDRHGEGRWSGAGHGLYSSDQRQTPS